MKHSYLLATAILVVGLECISLASKHTWLLDHPTRNETLSPSTDIETPLLIDNIIKDSVSGQASAQARFATFQRSQPLLKLGRAAMGSKQYEQAQSLFLRAITIYAEDPFSWLLLADAYERQGKNSKALEAYHTLVYSDGWGGSVGSDPTTHMRFVLALCRSDQYPEAAAVFNETMDDSARGSIPDEVMVNAKQIGGDAALTPYIEKYSLLPMRFDANDPDKRLLQAAAHYVLGTKQPSFGPPAAGEQMRHLQAAIRLAPKWGQAHSALADALQRQGQTQAAKAAQKRALALGDHNSLKERLIHANDEGQHAHQLLYHPDHPEYYQYSDPKMIPTKAEVDAALIELKKKNGANPTGQKSN